MILFKREPCEDCRLYGTAQSRVAVDSSTNEAQKAELLGRSVTGSGKELASKARPETFEHARWADGSARTAKIKARWEPGSAATATLIAASVVIVDASLTSGFQKPRVAVIHS